MIVWQAAILRCFERLSPSMYFELRLQFVDLAVEYQIKETVKKFNLPF